MAKKLIKNRLQKERKFKEKCKKIALHCLCNLHNFNSEERNFIYECVDRIYAEELLSRSELERLKLLVKKPYTFIY